MDELQMITPTDFLTWIESGDWTMLNLKMRTNVTRKIVNPISDFLGEFYEPRYNSVSGINLSGEGYGAINPEICQILEDLFEDKLIQVVLNTPGPGIGTLPYIFENARYIPPCSDAYCKRIQLVMYAVDLDLTPVDLKIRNRWHQDPFLFPDEVMVQLSKKKNRRRDEVMLQDTKVVEDPLPLP